MLPFLTRSAMLCAALVVILTLLAPVVGVLRLLALVIVLVGLVRWLRRRLGRLRGGGATAAG